MLPQRIQLRCAVRSEEAITDNAGEIEDNGSSTQCAQRDRSTVFNPIFRRPTDELGIGKRKIGCLATNFGHIGRPSRLNKLLPLLGGHGNKRTRHTTSVGICSALFVIYPDMSESGSVVYWCAEAALLHGLPDQIGCGCSRMARMSRFCNTILPSIKFPYRIQNPSCNFRKVCYAKKVNQRRVLRDRHQRTLRLRSIGNASALEAGTLSITGATGRWISIGSGSTRVL